jgi:hypothetical protein
MSTARRLSPRQDRALNLWKLGWPASVIVQECGFRSTRQFWKFIKTRRERGDPRAAKRFIPNGKKRIVELFILNNPLAQSDCRYARDCGFSSVAIGDRFGCPDHTVRYVRHKMRKAGLIPTREAA